MSTLATPPITKHPLDWKAEKKTGHPTYCLAVALAWHTRLSSPDYLPDAETPYGGVVVDPSGNETRPMTEAQYDGMIAAAQQLLRDVRDAAGKAQPPVQAKHIRILTHSDAHHAVIVRMPVGLDGTSLLRAIMEAPDAARKDTMCYETSQRILWPAEGTPARADLMEQFNYAFTMVYPDEYLKLAGWRGTEIKKRD